MANIIIEEYLKNWHEYETKAKGLLFFKDIQPDVVNKNNEIVMTMKLIKDLLSILDEKEHYIIEEFYYKKEKADVICNRMNISRAYFFRKKKQALNKMDKFLSELDIK